MTDEVDGIFSSRPPQRPSFTERLGQGLAEASADTSEEIVGSGPYKPYGFFPSGGVGESCDVRRWVDGTNTPQGIEFSYRLLLQIAYTGEEELKLALPDCIVVIHGKRLNDLRRRLARRTVTFMQEYNPCVWPLPALEDPVIDRIEVVRPEKFRPRDLG